MTVILKVLLTMHSVYHIPFYSTPDLQISSANLLLFPPTQGVILAVLNCVVNIIANTCRTNLTQYNC